MYFLKILFDRVGKYSASDAPFEKGKWGESGDPVQDWKQILWTWA